MIRYTLKCAQGHEFESWFASGSAYESLQDAGHVTCVICGSGQVEKALMAPSVTPARNSAGSAGNGLEGTGEGPTVPETTPAPSGAANTAPKGPTPTQRAEIKRKLTELRKHVEANSDYVGKGFAREARAIHLGDAPERAIWGEAKPEEARELLEEGIEVAPLPFIPKSRSN